MSKIKKMIAIRKNRIENGIRDEFLGSKPHSKGEVFSRSRMVFLEKMVETTIRAELIKTEIQNLINKTLIA